ncbi:hypothetical protein JA9_000768 [Meyerozyma sp. JA9]|nr:hypothetical protein JA9_000768 [Meyerozyma sp. JA9]
MGYPSPLKVATRKLNDDVVISSCPFSVRNLFHLGARMACINSNGKIVIWSPLPYGPHVIEALQLLTGKTSSDPRDYDVTHIVVANLQHDVGVRSVQPQFPQSKVIAAHTLNYDPLDYKLTKELGNKPVKLQDIAAANGDTISGYENLDFIYLSKHQNRELVVYENKHKILFESDVLVISGDRSSGTLEQYSEATGFPKGYNPHTGRAVFGNLLYPQGWISQWLQRRLNGFKFPEGIEGCRAILSWDIETIVPSHGNLVDSNGGEVLRQVFGFKK